MQKDYLYEVAEQAIVITKYLGEKEHVQIPEELEGLPVRVIGKEAFSDCGVESVTVPASVREIRDGAFKFCLGLQELHLAEGLMVWGADVVLVTPISELYIPSTVHTIKNPHELGGLKLNIAPDNPHYYSDGYGLYEKHPEGNVILAVDLRGECTEYRIPEGTVEVGQGAFCGQETILEVWCPDSLRVIADESFESCRKLKKIHLNEGLKEIGYNAFSYCALEGTVELPSTLEKMGDKVFTNTFDWDQYKDELEKIIISKENEYFYTDADGLYRKLPDGTLELLRYFGKDNMCKMSEQVSCIGPHAFRRGEFKEVTIPSSVVKVGEKAFFENPNIAALHVEQDQTEIYIPRIPVYRKDEITSLLNSCEETYRFDYAGYDELWNTYLYVQDQAGMAVFRLKYPRDLSAEREAFYWSWLKEHFLEVMEDLAAREDRDRLAQLAHIGFFDSSNVDEAIDILNNCRKTELLGFLMEYKQNNLETEEFDFSL